MDLDELHQHVQRGGGVLLLRYQTASKDEREAAQALLNDITSRMKRANDEGYRVGHAAAVDRQKKRTPLPTGHTHGTFNVHNPDGSTLVELHVDEARIRDINDANKLRGLRADTIVVYPDPTIPEALKTYLHDEVIAPIRADIADRKPHPGERKLREAGSIYARDTERETDVAYLKRFAHELEARMHDLERQQHTGEEPRAVPQHESADWALMVVKRLEALETAVAQKESTRSAVQSYSSLQKVDAEQGKTLNELLTSLEDAGRRVLELERWRKACSGANTYAEETGTLAKRLDEVERLSKMVAGVLDGDCDARNSKVVNDLDRRTREAHDKFAGTGRQLSGRIEKIEEWMRAATARLNAIEIWKNDTLSKSLEAITETLEKHAQYMQGVPPLALIQEEFEGKLREHRAMWHALKERLDALNGGFETVTKELYDHAHTLLDRTHCISVPCVVADSEERRAEREADYRAREPG